MRGHYPCPSCGLVREARPESLCRGCAVSDGKRAAGFGAIEIDDTVRGLIREAVNELRETAA